MFGNRDQIRQVYVDVWNKLQNGTAILEPMEMIIADIIQLHPEYHPIFNNPDILNNDFTPEQGKTNPFLHMGMHIAIREQITTNRPDGIKALYSKRCKSEDIHEVEHKMLECLGTALWQAQRNGHEVNEKEYMECLKKRLS